MAFEGLVGVFFFGFVFGKIMEMLRLLVDFRRSCGVFWTKLCPG